MERGYSGLRRSRKRAHSTKCPCCYSSEEEQETHASAKREKVKDHGSQNNGKRTSKRKRRLSCDDDDNNNYEDASKNATDAAEDLHGTQKSKTANRKTLLHKPKKSREKVKTVSSKQESSSSTLNGVKLGAKSKEGGKNGQATVKKKSKTGLSLLQSRDESIVKTENSKKKSSTQILSKPKKSEKKSAKQKCKADSEELNKSEEEPQEKCLNGVKKSSKVKSAASSASDVVQLQSNDAVKEVKNSISNNITKVGTKLNKAEIKKQNKTRSKNNKSNDVQSGSSFDGSKKSLVLGSKKQPNSLSKNSGNVVNRKVEVFDHLFCELKKCPGHSKVTVSSAAELLLRLTADKLKSLLHASTSKKLQSGTVDDNLKKSSPAKAQSTVSLSRPKRQRTESEKSLSQSSEVSSGSFLSSPSKSASGQAEKVKLSQAAEALVSFRANPTILRQERAEGDLRLPIPAVKVTATKNLEKKSSSPSKVIGCNPLDGTAESSMHVLTTTNEPKASQSSVNAISTASQSQATTQLSLSPAIHGTLQHTIGFPSIETSLQQVATVQQNLMNLSQLTSQLNPVSAVPVPLNPKARVHGAEKSRLMNQTGMQNVQALFCQPTQPPNIQTSVAIQTPVTTLTACGSNQQLQPQQPLKGMEDVVSCVGSRSTTNMLWNIKPATPPVVYLTSPQSLSGVRARHIIPQNEGHRPLPFTTGMAKVHSAGIPKAPLNSVSTCGVMTLGKVTVVNQAASLPTTQAVNMTCQRPILPREQRLPSLFTSMHQGASQLPVTTISGQISHSFPPVCMGSMPVQFGGIHVTSALTSLSNVMTQAPISQSPPIEVPVMQTPVVTTGQITATTSPVNAKQAVKKFVHQRTKSAELRRSESLTNILLNEPVASPSVAEQPEVSIASTCSSQSDQAQVQPDNKSTSITSEFNVQQAASALLSISSQDGLDTVDTSQPGGGEGEDSLDEHDDEVVFTSKGVFRVGDVDVDPKYNRIGIEGYTCGKCGKIFTSLSYLARHIKRVCPDMSCRKWRCTMCDKAFRHPFGLQQHIYTHTGERPHKCSQCPKAFYSSNDLRRHSRIHSGERPYHCKHCDKSFATTISLKTHTYIHTGEKPHKCPHCPKTFATSSKLGRHIVTHSEQRPFACEHCPKSFNRSGDLRRHNMHVHDSRDKPVDFEDCGTPLSTTGNVTVPSNGTKDKDSVTGQVYQCSVCAEVFDTSSELRDHVTCHSNMVSTVPNHSLDQKSSDDVDQLDESTESGSIDSN